eukprot:4029838-Pyramimonas_sp.AAC.1
MAAAAAKPGEDLPPAPGMSDSQASVPQQFQAKLPAWGLKRAATSRGSVVGQQQQGDKKLKATDLKQQTEQ